MHIEIPLTLTVKQQEMFNAFFNDPSTRWIVNVGGKGSAKTTFAVYALIYMFFNEKFKGSRILIARDKIRDLKNTLVAEFERTLIRNGLSLKQAKDIIYTNEMTQIIRNELLDITIYWLSLGEKNDQYASVLSYEFNVAIIDEANRIPYEAFLEVNSRLRLPHHFHKGMLILNPTNREHWIYKVFVEQEYPQSKVIQSSVYDNWLTERLTIDDLKTFDKYIAPNGQVFFVDTKRNIRYGGYVFDKNYPNIIYIKRFVLPHSYLVDMEKKSYAYRHVMMEGNWGEIFEGGGFYSDAFTEWHIVDDDNIEYVRFYVGLDFGFRRPAMVLVGETRFAGQLVILDAFLGENMSYKEFINAVNEVLAKHKLSIYYRDIEIYGDIAGTQREQSDGISLIKKIEDTFGIRIYTRKVPFRQSVELIKDALETRISLTGSPSYKLMVHKNASLVIQGFLGGFKINRTSTGLEKEKDDYFEHIHDAMRYVLYPVLQRMQRPAKPSFKVPTS